MARLICRTDFLARLCCLLAFLAISEPAQWTNILLRPLLNEESLGEEEDQTEEQEFAKKASTHTVRRQSHRRLDTPKIANTVDDRATAHPSLSAQALSTPAAVTCRNGAGVSLRC